VQVKGEKKREVKIEGNIEWTGRMEEKERNKV
jgi:hypothetical protein